ncbi:MAG: ribose 5-phosphate isomerase B [Defluviitaleaceae bacterium]|nr:ribose 5-phosphate isomerase B [Defluviitaleaceae bacterium]
MIAIGCDHGGFTLKSTIIKYFDENRIKYKDFGCFNTESVDYPDIAQEVCKSIVSGECESGILVCGTGIGMSIAANKIKGIRAACCSDTFSAKLTKEHNDSNVLCIGERVVGQGLAIMLVENFLNAKFEGGRHLARVEKLEK